MSINHVARLPKSTKEFHNKTPKRENKHYNQVPLHRTVTSLFVLKALVISTLLQLHLPDQVTTIDGPILMPD
jgi:hypothetical protein